MDDDVTAEKNAQLLKDSNKLAALEAAGVDNWEGYSYAMSILAEWEEQDTDEFQ